ncbi:DUF3152 domain-containing protein [Streptomyces thermoalcalitolerans]|uniref:DUF3152 domain-containing protein n=1 Tax=Streptomyces thermoalcalitolerans TaxID=65605 RepID=UPI0031DC1492
MGRHSRRGPAPRGNTADTTAAQDGRELRQGREPGGGSGEAWDRPDPWRGPGGRPGPGAVPGEPAGAGGPVHGTSARAPYFGDGTPARGVPRFPDGTPAHGPYGAPAQGAPWPPGGTPAHGMPTSADAAPAWDAPRAPDGRPVPSAPEVRGGHPEQREAGGGWGQWETGGAAARGAEATGAGAPGGMDALAEARAPVPRQRQSPPAGPRQEYVNAFDEGAPLTPRPRGGAPSARPAAVSSVPSDGQGAGTGRGPGTTGTKGRTYTGIAAAAVTTALAVVVAGQVADGRSGTDVRAHSVPDRTGHGAADVAAVDGKPAEPPPSTRALTYGQKMNMKYELSPTLKGPGEFETVPGTARAPGKGRTYGRTYTYRVDVEKGLGLDGELFAEAVHRTLNDDRSWAHGGRRAFERVSSGRPDFVITLASPGTTAVWCAKSGLDTTQENVSCDSASTERVMINAYRWAQGSETYGDKMYAYRQMLINHEVGHRLGYGHVTCDKDGALAPVMQQQTKFLEYNGIRCLPNPWPYPGS